MSGVDKKPMPVETFDEAWKYIEQGYPLLVAVGHEWFGDLIYVYRLNSVEYYFGYTYTLGLEEFEIIPINETKNLLKRLFAKYGYGIIFPGLVNWTEKDLKEVMADENFKFKWWQKLLMVFNYLRAIKRKFNPKSRLIEYYLD